MEDKLEFSQNNLKMPVCRTISKYSGPIQLINNNSKIELLPHQDFFWWPNITK